MGTLRGGTQTSGGEEGCLFELAYAPACRRLYVGGTMKNMPALPRRAHAAYYKANNRLGRDISVPQDCPSTPWEGRDLQQAVPQNIVVKESLSSGIYSSVCLYVCPHSFYFRTLSNSRNTRSSNTIFIRRIRPIRTLYTDIYYTWPPQNEIPTVGGALGLQKYIAAEHLRSVIQHHGCLPLHIRAPQHLPETISCKLQAVRIVA